jgi:plastocyanin
MSQDLRTEDRAAEEARPRARSPRLPPIAYPLLGLLFGAALVWAFAEIMFVLSEHRLDVGGISLSGKTVAAVVALLMAANILIGGALVAYGGRVRRRPSSFPLLLGAGALVIAGGGAAMLVGGEEEAPRPPPQQIQVAAENTMFDPTELSVSLGPPVEIRFDNRDKDQHNIVIFDGEDESAPVLLDGEVITGPSQTTYQWSPPRPGSYFFHCKIHPVQMTGSITVQEGPPGGPGGGPPPDSAEISATNRQFSTASLALPAGRPVTIHFTNNDPDQHNVAIFRGEDATGDVVFRGEIFAGPETMEYRFDAPEPGEYFFHCDVHPDMTGTITFH